MDVSFVWLVLHGVRRLCMGHEPNIDLRRFRGVRSWIGIDLIAFGVFGLERSCYRAMLAACRYSSWSEE